MTTNRANDVLEKAIYLTFKNKERLSITVDELSQDAMELILKLMGVQESFEGRLINLSLKYTKGGLCRVKVGAPTVPGIVVTVTDAGSAKEFKAKLLARWVGGEFVSNVDNVDEELSQEDIDLDRSQHTYETGGFRRGEMLLIGALRHNYKTGFCSQHAHETGGEVILDELEQVEVGTIGATRTYEHGRGMVAAATLAALNARGMVVSPPNRRPRPTKKPHNPWEHSGLTARVVNKDEDDISW